MPTPTGPLQQLSLRVTPEQRRSLQAAAAASGSSLSSFVREAALAVAARTLADRTRFVLPPERWAAFAAALDRPARPVPGLARLLAAPSLFGPPRETLSDDHTAPHPGSESADPLA